MPKRLKGTLRVTMLGVTSRMTITSDGLAGMSLEDMVDLTFSVVVRWAMVGVVGMDAAAAVVRRRPPAMKGVSLLGVDEVDELVV
jgi:hypothetical protein